MFADHIKLPRQTVAGWFAGDHGPSAAALVRLSERTDRTSIDWLLFGDGGKEPRKRGETWPRVEFEEEFARRLAARLDEAAAAGRIAGPRPTVTPLLPKGATPSTPREAGWWIDVGAIFDAMAEQVIRDVQAADEADALRRDLSTQIDQLQTIAAEVDAPGTGGPLGALFVQSGPALLRRIADKIESIRQSADRTAPPLLSRPVRRFPGRTAQDDRHHIGVPRPDAPLFQFGEQAPVPALLARRFAPPGGGRRDADPPDGGAKPRREDG